MDTVTMNIAAHRNVEAAVGERDRLAKLMEATGSIGSNAGMFGRVPNGARAAAVLSAAVAGVTQQVSEGGRTVDDIRSSAAAAAQIGEQSDQEAERALAQARAAALGHFDAETSARAGGW
ncbi:hypothetical protein [Streptomyces sp. MP131-18]|uniref:hypothetical protein n=1 Tax=Streptomyces sp. MP131-18 TaxID=1857892 RepID=UPI00097BD2AC|nr:hypothetical protein [Streptomyces sp. MP131-18]ONK16061.1 hypothetical protein STBA_69110 [Streptomyces sp. MP131-18]